MGEGAEEATVAGTQQEGDRNRNENDRRSEEKETGSRNFRGRMSLVLPKQLATD